MFSKRGVKSWAQISAAVFLVSYPVHLTWEMLQTPLYECSKLVGKELIPHLLWATLGDAAIMVGMYWLGGLGFRQRGLVPADDQRSSGPNYRVRLASERAD